jgi:hypothetical protein
MTHNGFKVIHVKLLTQNAINNFTPANIEIAKIIYFYGFLQIVLKCILYICTFVRIFIMCKGLNLINFHN